MKKTFLHTSRWLGLPGKKEVELSKSKVHGIACIYKKTRNALKAFRVQRLGKADRFAC